MVVPGSFTARLTVDSGSGLSVLERSFDVLVDPRVAADGVTLADMQAQFDLGMEILAAIEDADATIERLENAQERAAEGSDVAKELEEIERALLTDETISSYPQPMLRDQMNYLYRNSQAADQEPGADMYERLEVLGTKAIGVRSQGGALHPRHDRVTVFELLGVDLQSHVHVPKPQPVEAVGVGLRRQHWAFAHETAKPCAVGLRGGHGVGDPM